MMVSCISDSTSSSVTDISTDAEIKSFTLAANTTVAANLNLVHFTINQHTGEIYNSDSLPVGTKLKKMLANITVYSASKITIIYPTTGDSKDYSTTDSIDFRSPIHIKVTALDKVNEMVYDVRVNVHQVKPDTLEWRKQSFNGWDQEAFTANKTVAFNGDLLTYLQNAGTFTLYKSALSDGANWLPKGQNLPMAANIESMTEFQSKLYVTTSDKELYSSTDGSNWTKVSANFSIVALYGSLTDIDGTTRLMVACEDNGALKLASSTDGSAFTLCDNTVLPLDFPVSGFSVISKTIALTEKLTIIAGKNKAGNLLNAVHQLYWDKSGFHAGYNIENGGNWFSKRSGAFAYSYGNKMFVSCGYNGSSDISDVYSSTNNGVSWQTDTVRVLPEVKIFARRSHGSVVVDNSHYIWLFGGQSHSGDAIEGVKEIWKGRINRYGFIIQ